MRQDSIPDHNSFSFPNLGHEMAWISELQEGLLASFASKDLVTVSNLIHTDSHGFFSKEKLLV